jgi:ferrous iron transport protein A
MDTQTILTRGFPLIQAGEDEPVEIVGIAGGGSVHRRLSELGLVPGVRIRRITGQPGGPILIALGASRIAIGFGMAMKVRVVPVAREKAGR